MDTAAIYPRPRTTIRNPKHSVYPHLLRGVKIERVNQVWSTDITYIPMEQGLAIVNVFIERFWRSMKYEDISRKAYKTTTDLYNGLRDTSSLTRLSGRINRSTVKHR